MLSWIVMSVAMLSSSILGVIMLGVIKQSVVMLCCVSWCRISLWCHFVKLCFIMLNAKVLIVIILALILTVSILCVVVRYNVVAPTSDIVKWLIIAWKIHETCHRQGAESRWRHNLTFMVPAEILVNDVKIGAWTFSGTTLGVTTFIIMEHHTLKNVNSCRIPKFTFT